MNMYDVGLNSAIADIRCLLIGEASPNPYIFLIPIAGQYSIPSANGMVAKSRVGG